MSATNPDHPTLPDLISWTIFCEKYGSPRSPLCISLRNTFFYIFLHIISFFPFIHRCYLIWIMVNKCFGGAYRFHLHGTSESSFCLSLLKTLNFNLLSSVRPAPRQSLWHSARCYYRQLHFRPLVVGASTVWVRTEGLSLPLISRHSLGFYLLPISLMDRKR